MAGCKVSHFAIFGGAGVTIGSIGLYILAKYFGIGAYRLKRITAFLNPWADPLDTGWQIIQGLYAIGSGGLFGVGLGNSRQKYLYIAEPHNDYIFAVLAEELGFIGCIVVILLFAVFIWRGIIISMKSSRYVWKFTSLWNYSTYRFPSYYKYSCCNIFNASNRNCTFHFLVMEELRS